MLVDNSNYEYRGSLRPDDILNDIGARGMELGILKKYQIRIPFNIEAIPVEKFELEHKNAQRVGDRYIKTAPSIATIKNDGSKGVKPNINTVINKINELYNILILDFYSERFIINHCRKWLTIV